MNLNKMNSFSLLSTKKLSNLNKKNAGENMYNLCSNRERINAGGNFLSLFFSKRLVIAIGAIICVLLQNTCTFENKTNSQFGLTARFPRKLIEKKKDETGAMASLLSTLDVLWKKVSPLTSISNIKEGKLDSKKYPRKVKVFDMEKLLERCLENGKILDEYEIDVMLKYLTQPGCFSKLYALGTWWHVLRKEKNEMEIFHMQLSRLRRETAIICNYSIELSDSLYEEAQADYTHRAKTIESIYNDNIYDIFNRKDKSPEDYKDCVIKYQNEQENLREQFWDEWEKTFYERMSGKPFVKDIIIGPAEYEIVE
ncbi:Plasmodium exported protein, unknown function [Plasmodium knowlesi strain H]|uniref:Plasmodium RESA N-terminal domain-containing protein n=3 Tax=Plasmodium knowlesi TaxID=5850 RepID=A0A5K1U3B6_PLAKH|nr:Plasmodium exported protein (PHIST), unknown function [Plasmodium knowlesi strain H]OTN66041.1 Uncharacterized protein PKNOH_S100070000 [Plasmodium knowlesi]CAA9988049.1 Plasmodium exported protein (PHIST), unknown function [Plasmodium knowlesi strain H]SBO21949.1 Plasmodium exported protein, unknown function [Plasmodium knowlesi strain H]SBO29504.1 Plasmodium exported protein, unknown function [Plasmodium knowlesi strain H]VVS77523.1 Plasmodium exported protein (PHIST), unknown function [P|eukprot:XP_002259028.1 hypothetical protein, conserved in Plasmodium species [Plasmodium knowlesi strain H]